MAPKPSKLLIMPFTKAPRMIRVPSSSEISACCGQIKGMREPEAGRSNRQRAAATAHSAAMDTMTERLTIPSLSARKPQAAAISKTKRTKTAIFIG